MNQAKDLLLFDVDGTLVESTQKLGPEMVSMLCSLSAKNMYELGIVGGSGYNKIVDQLAPLNEVNDRCITHIFSENGCVYHKNGILQRKENIREHKLYPEMNLLVKRALGFLSNVPYTISGQFIDLRNGIIYISLIGCQATLQERIYFQDLDKVHGYRKALLWELQELGKELGITNTIAILEGGSVGIGIHPIEYDKVQVAEFLRPLLGDTYSSISYFGDKYLPSGNDCSLLNHEIIKGYKVDSVSDTLHLLQKIINL